MGDHPIGHVTRRIIVENTTARTLTFVLEPWANEYPMAPNQRFIIEGEGPAHHADFHVEEVRGDYLFVYAWDGSDARILYEDGRVLDDWTGLRVPIFATPPKKSSQDT